MSKCNIKVLLDEKFFKNSCPEYKDIISAGKLCGIELVISFFSRGYTKYLSLLDDSFEQKDSMRLNSDLDEKGFILLSVPYPKSDFFMEVGELVEYSYQFDKYQK